MGTTPRTLIGVTVSVVLLASPSARAEKIRYDYHPTATFASLKTFALKNPDVLESVSHKTTTYDSPFVYSRTHTAVAAQLERRGLKQTDDSPDVYVTTRWTFKPEYTVYASSGAYPWGGY